MKKSRPEQNNVDRVQTTGGLTSVRYNFYDAPCSSLDIVGRTIFPMDRKPEGTEFE